MNKLLRSAFRAPIYLHHWRCGRLLGRRFLLLVHKGRRSGARRETVLEVVEFRADGPEAIVMSAFGQNAGWFRNIAAAPGAEVIIGSRRFAAVHRVLDIDEGVGVIAGYERRNRLVAPLIRLVFSRLLGWRYSGSAADRRRLVAQLPLVAFRPRV